MHAPSSGKQTESQLVSCRAHQSQLLFFPVAAIIFAAVLGSGSSLEAVQPVFLDFDTQFTAGSDITYSAPERAAVLAAMDTDYASFDYSFSLTAPTSGDFSTIFFGANGIVGGLADKIDFRNLDMNDTAGVNLAAILGTTPSTSDKVGLASTVGSHELGHLGGLRHGDSQGPIGAGVHDPPGAFKEVNHDFIWYNPSYPGPTTTATETTGHTMASPASMGQSIAEAIADADFSERSAIKLAFNETGTVVSETGGAHGTIGTAQAIALAPLSVPNTLLSGTNAGLPFDVEALAVIDAAISVVGEVDLYSFLGSAGDLLNIEVISNVISDRLSVVDPQIRVLDGSGTVIPYYSSTAFNDDEFESFDAILIDLFLPSDGTFFFEVTAHPNDPTGQYELFAYRFTTIPEPGSLALAGLGGLFLAGIAWRRRRRRSA